MDREGRGCWAEAGVRGKRKYGFRASTTLAAVLGGSRSQEFDPAPGCHRSSKTHPASPLHLPLVLPTSRLILNPNLLPSLLSPRSLPWLIPTPQAPPNCRAGPFGPKACIRDRDRRAGAMTVIGGGVEGQKAEGKCGQLIPGPRVPEKPSGLSRPRGRGTVCPVCVGLAPSMCSGNTV